MRRPIAGRARGGVGSASGGRTRSGRPTATATRMLHAGRPAPAPELCARDGAVGERWRWPRCRPRRRRSCTPCSADIAEKNAHAHSARATVDVSGVSHSHGVCAKVAGTASASDGHPRACAKFWRARKFSACSSRRRRRGGARASASAASRRSTSRAPPFRTWTAVGVDQRGAFGVDARGAGRVRPAVRAVPAADGARDRVDGVRRALPRLGLRDRLRRARRRSSRRSTASSASVGGGLGVNGVNGVFSIYI